MKLLTLSVIGAATLVLYVFLCLLHGMSLIRTNMRWILLKYFIPSSLIFFLRRFFVNIAPIQFFLLILSLVFSVALVFLVFRRPALTYVRWAIVVCVCFSLLSNVMCYAMLFSEKPMNWAGSYIATEFLGSLSWLYFSRCYACELENRPKLNLLHLSSLVFVLLLFIFTPLHLFVSSVSSSMLVVLPLTFFGFLVLLVSMIILILALVYLESTLVNSIHGELWRIKFFILGAFSILVGQVFTLSLGLLYRSIDLSFAPVRQTGFVIGIAFFLYSSFFRGGSLPVIISRRRAQTSLVLFGAGAYLLFLGALGFAISLTETSGTRSILLAFGLVVGVCLLTLLLSYQVRRRCQRLLQQYFYKEKYDYRIQWLSFTKRLATTRSRSDLYQSILLGFCDTFGMGGAVLYLKGDVDSDYIPALAWEVNEVSPVIASDDILPSRLSSELVPIVLHDFLCSNSSVISTFLSSSEARFAVPLHGEDDLIGFILLTRPVDKTEEYLHEDFDLMEALANQGYSSLLNLRLSDLLSQARDMEIMGKVSTFIVHDLKNLIYPLTLIVQNSKLYIHDPEFQGDMLRSLENTVAKMHVLISQLRLLPTRENLKLEDADLRQIVQDALVTIPIPGAVFLGEPVLARVDRSQFQKVILNLVLNAREASPDGAPILVETGRDKTPYLRVSDNGSGMTSQFVCESLFQPFRTTKNKGMGIGLYQCKQIVEAHGGAIDVVSTQGEGSVFTVRLPDPEHITVSEGA